MADTQTITSVKAPWDVQIPYLQQAYGAAQSLFGTGGPQYYPDSTVANLSPEMQQWMGNISNYANANPYNQAAQPVYQATLRGDYLNNNPWLDQTFNQAANNVSRQFSQNVLPGANAAFSMAGRTGSGAHQNAVDWASGLYGQNLNDLATKIYGGNYANERANQQQAMLSMPQMNAALAAQLNQQKAVGDVSTGQSQAQLTDLVNRFQFGQQRPYEALNQYLAQIGGSQGGSASETRPIYSNDTAQNFGLALGGLGLLKNLFF